MTKPPAHPGFYIKNEIIPPDVSIADAARHMKVTRAALSNLLNGKAALSPEMIIKLEKAFNADRTKLVAAQKQYEEYQLDELDRALAVKTYAPSFLDVIAAEINAWADHMQAESLLAVLLRRLVMATGNHITKIDFPGYDNSRRPGYDGEVISTSAHPWIPDGHSIWEFGKDKNILSKANSDFNKRVKETSVEKRASMTFVFVSPRNWPGKKRWLEERLASGHWKDVRVYDASDLEQWLEQSIQTKCWFREILGKDEEGLKSLDKCWGDWSKATNPALSEKIFDDSITQHLKKISQFLSSEPTAPLTITADTKEEGLAFLCVAISQLNDEMVNCHARTVVALTPNAFQKISAASAKSIIIVKDDEVEHEISGSQKQNHIMIVRNRFDTRDGANIDLRPPSHECFNTALEAMGVARDDIDRLARQSGQTPSILRRHLTDFPALKQPLWSTDNVTVQRLLPLLFAGSWQITNKCDLDILLCLCNYSAVDDIHADINALLNQEDTPLWASKNCQGLKSKADVLFALSRHITQKQIDNFFILAACILSESDPALDLPKEDRWMANIYEKTRDHSDILREGICETLVLLSAHVDGLFENDLNHHVRHKVSQLIESLLKPFLGRTWLEQSDDLPYYAEASPETFFNLIEEDLGAKEPTILSLMESADSGMLGSKCYRTGLCWALELLAWKPENLSRAMLLLARLSTIEIDDNWSNKPIESLHAIFRFWMPQTAANLEQRKAALNLLCKHHPDIGWRICTAQFRAGSGVGHYSYKPRWRNDGSGFGEPTTRGERANFYHFAIAKCLDWPEPNVQKLSDLTSRLQLLNPEQLDQYWSIMDAWLESIPTDENKARIREAIRRYAFTKRQFKTISQAVKDRAKTLYEALSPDDLVVRYSWLFKDNWVDYAADELEDDDLDYKERDKRISQQRKDVFAQIWQQENYPGIKRLLSIGNAAYSIGQCACDVIRNDETIISVITNLIDDALSNDERNKYEGCLLGLFSTGTIKTERKNRLVEHLLSSFLADDKFDKAVLLLNCLPFTPDTWGMVDKLDKSLQDQYWKTVQPHWSDLDEGHMSYMINKMLESNRPNAAFSNVHLNWKKVGTKDIVALLQRLGEKSDEPQSSLRFQAHDIVHALEALNKRVDETDKKLQEELANLEFRYIRTLQYDSYGIPNLRQRIMKNPLLFVQAVAFVYKRSDGRDDPGEWFGSADIDRKELANSGDALLRSLKVIPGSRSNGTIKYEKLLHWFEQARELLQAHGRTEIGDHMIGQLLANAPKDDDGIWPCKPVRDVLEIASSKEMGSGLSIGVQNARGATTRGDGGQQERDLAATYRQHASKLSIEYPFVASVLENIAQSYDRHAEFWDDDSEVRYRTHGF